MDYKVQKDLQIKTVLTDLWSWVRKVAFWKIDPSEKNYLFLNVLNHNGLGINLII